GARLTVRSTRPPFPAMIGAAARAGTTKRAAPVRRRPGRVVAGSRLLFVGQPDLARGGPSRLAKVVPDRVGLLPHHALGRVRERLPLAAVLAHPHALAAVRGLDDPVVDALAGRASRLLLLLGRCAT